MSEQLLIGTDPEFFLFKDGKPISGHGLIPGTKDKPHTMTHETTCQLDGVACELGIKAAADCATFSNRIQSALNFAESMLPRGTVLKPVPSVFFDKTYYDKEIPEDCKVLGCTPDRDAYNDGKINPIPSIVSNINGVMRTGGGHIHFGWTKNEDVNSEDHINNCILVIRNIDYLFTFYERLWDNDVQRRQMYGKPGAFRVKPYGCEYRSPSNAWLRNPQTQRFVFELARYAFWLTYAGYDLRNENLRKYKIADLSEIYDIEIPASLQKAIAKSSSGSLPSDDRYVFIHKKTIGGVSLYEWLNGYIFPRARDISINLNISPPALTTYARHFYPPHSSSAKALERTEEWKKMRDLLHCIYGHDYLRT